MNKKNICIVTGSRSDYGYLRIIIEKIFNSSKLNLSLIVTGMHLLKNHGYTIDLIKKNGIPITKIIPMYDENDSSNINLAKAIGTSIVKFTDVFNEIKPDLVLLLGDRYEPFVAAIVASTLKIPIAHIHGGDVSGTIDEVLRHVITKLSHIHFPATFSSSNRIKLMGEEEWRIHMVGSTTIDAIKKKTLMNKQEICNKFGLDVSEKIVLCLQHPNVFEAEKAGEQMKITLKILKDLDLQSIIIYPNNDSGSNLIIDEIKRNMDNDKFKIFKNLERADYLSLLKNVDFLIGNSSGGFIESPFFKLPFINIGTRNKGRESAGNVINVSHNYDEIKSAILKAFSKDFKELCKTVKNPYGDGTASDKILKILEDLEINQDLLIKKLTYSL